MFPEAAQWVKPIPDCSASACPAACPPALDATMRMLGLGSLGCFALLTVCSHSPEARSIALLASERRYDPDVQNVVELRSGMICREVRWLTVDDYTYSSWWPFHIVDGVAEVGENYNEIGMPDYGLETAFDRAHRSCEAEAPRLLGTSASAEYKRR